MPGTARKAKAGGGFLDPSSTRLRDQTRAGRWESPMGFIAGISYLAVGLMAVLSAIVGIADDTGDVVTLALMGALWSLIGGVLVHLCRVPRSVRTATAFVGMMAAFSTLIGAAVVTYLVLGTFDRVDDALFEAVSGYTTTSASVVDDPERLSEAVLSFRASTQWIGGLAALVFVVVILPSMGVGGIEVTGRGRAQSAASITSRRTKAIVQRLVFVYAALTGVGTVLYLLGGMTPFDAMTYSATTISTGGFANHAGSFGHFDSVTVEWAGVGGMVLGGANLVLLYRGLLGRVRGGLLRSFELRAYLAVLVGATAIVTFVATPGQAVSHDTIRAAAFHVASATSTTGHFTTGWAGWEVGAQVLLLALVGVGSMSGSTGGGFRLVRAIALVGYLRREATAQLYPHAVVPVRVGKRRVSDEVASRMIGYQAQYVLLAAAGAFVVASFGPDLTTSISGAISAVANMGPALGDLAPGVDGHRVVDLARPARMCLLPLMFLGRLEIAPVLVANAIAAEAFRDRVRRWLDDRRGHADT